MCPRWSILLFDAKKLSASFHVKFREPGAKGRIKLKIPLVDFA